METETIGKIGLFFIITFGGTAGWFVFKDHFNKKRIITANGQTIVWKYPKFNLGLKTEEEITATLTGLIRENPTFNRPQIADALGIIIESAEEIPKDDIYLLRELHEKYARLKIEHAELIAKDPTFEATLEDKFLAEKRKLLGL